ncbi:hypothetical protein BKA82DRAFT_4015420 [Pisolithus tinctorius]|nr:hypothetical protein BKA82DRAFT_4015420 [Pisolithus tinctorius]
MKATVKHLHNQQCKPKEHKQASTGGQSPVTSVGPLSQWLGTVPRGDVMTGECREITLPTAWWRVQVKPAGSHSSREQPSSQHRWPHHAPMEDVMMVNHAANFPDIPSDVHMTLDEGVPSAHVQGTMFPEFNGTEWPHHVLSLGEGSDGKNKILFMRINDNLYTYESEKINSMKCNLRLCIIPPVPLYVRVLKEPEDKAPCIQKAQDLITYLNLWKRCKLGLNKVINLTLSIPALQEWIADAPVVLTPVPNVGSTPTPALIDHVAVQPHETQPASEQWPEPSSQAQPPGGCNLLTRQKGPSPLVGSLGVSLNYHQMLPPLTAPSRFGGSSSAKNRGTLIGVKMAHQEIN